jgi:midasin
LVSIWQHLRPLSNIGGPVKGRDIGLRDLEKWCARIERSLPSSSALAILEQNPAGLFANPALQDEVLLEASDTFMAWFDARPSSADKRAAMIRVVAEHIGMDEERAFVLLDSRRPALEVSTSTKQLRVGRSAMPVYPSSKRQRPADSRPFALTKPSLVLLERIAATASMGEPTLLVGETGTGKTTAVQYIATICRKPLTALNLSTQTESSDLLGGFKPIDAGVAARVLQTRWQKLFTETFSMAKAQNGAYLEAASKALGGRKWARLAELWASSARRAVDKLIKKDET